MFNLVRIRTVLWAIALSLFCQAGFAATLDLSSYPDFTPLQDVHDPNFTFDISPGVSAVVYEGKISLSGSHGGIGLRIIFSGTANQSSVVTRGFGSCQNEFDYVFWYLDNGVVDSFATFTPGAGRCSTHTLNRSFEHNEIRFDVGTNLGGMYIGPLSNDVSDVNVIEATPIPTLSTWAMVLLSVLMLMGAIIALRRWRYE